MLLWTCGENMLEILSTGSKSPLKKYKFIQRENMYNTYIYDIHR